MKYTLTNLTSGFNMVSGIKDGKKVYISFCEDCDINKGGYYCQVYDNEDMDNEIDNFVIQAEDVAVGLTDKMVEDYLNSKW